jgi:IclR-like helix-turn-helix domain-containing protein
MAAELPVIVAGVVVCPSPPTEMRSSEVAVAEQRSASARSVGRTPDLLGLLARDAPLGVTEIAGRLGPSKPAAHRLLDFVNPAR